jgi:hypothetical protein
MQYATGKHPLDKIPKPVSDDDLSKPFAIGLRPLAAGDMLQIDQDLVPYRREKQQLYEAGFEQVCMAEADNLNAQREAANLINDNLHRFHQDLYRFKGNQVVCRSTDEVFTLPGTLPCTMPIADSALLVPEDLVLMSRDDSGWRLVAASLCFPSSWNLAEKFAKPLENIHRPVPIPEQMDVRINRIFDNLQPALPVWRSNWSLYGDGHLRHDRTEHQNRQPSKMLDENAHFRTEYQTLHKLPVSGDILFTIRIKTRPIREYATNVGGRKTLDRLYKHCLAMSDEERDYKGMVHNADRLLAWLAEHRDTQHDG